MKVRMPTVEVDAEFRRRLRMYFGRPGLATREEVRLWRTERGVRDDLDLCDETDAEGGNTFGYINSETKNTKG